MHSETFTVSFRGIRMSVVLPQGTPRDVRHFFQFGDIASVRHQLSPRAQGGNCTGFEYQLKPDTGFALLLNSPNIVAPQFAQLYVELYPAFNNFS